MKTMEAMCVSVCMHACMHAHEEAMPIEDGQIVSLGDSHIEHVHSRLAILARVVNLEYS